MKYRNVILIGFFLSSVASAKTFYVSPAGNNNNSGLSQALPFKTIAQASQSVVAGDTIRLMCDKSAKPINCKYSETIYPTVSGTSSAPITYTSDDPANPAVIVAPTMRISGMYLNNVNYIVISGINVDGGGDYNHTNHAFSMFVWILGTSSHITVTGCDLRNANGYSGIEVQDQSSYITISNNVIDDVGIFYDTYDVPATATASVICLVDGWRCLTGDGIAVDSTVSKAYPHHVLIEHNKLSHSGHDLLSLNGQYNVAQYNYFDNDWSYIPPFNDQRGYRNASIEGTNNVFQGNYLSHAGPGMKNTTWLYNVIMKAQGAHNIVRQNVLAFNNYVGIGSDIFSGDYFNQIGQAGYDRIYNNTLYQIGAFAWRSTFPSDPTMYRDGDVFKNNLIEQDRLDPAASLSFNAYADNDIWLNTGDSPHPMANILISGNLIDPFGGKDPTFMFPTMTIAEAETKYPNNISNNLLKVTPLFVKTNPVEYGDFAQIANSPGTNCAQFLTTVSSPDNTTSNQIQVADASYFTDGYPTQNAGPIIPADVIQLADTNQQAKIVSIDYATNTLHLASTVTVKSGQGVSLPFTGTKAPDVGAIQHGVSFTLPGPGTQTIVATNPTPTPTATPPPSAPTTSILSPVSGALVP